MADPRAIVIGDASGIGEARARRLAAAGARVTVADRAQPQQARQFMTKLSD